jgi:hypothetical protein
MLDTPRINTDLVETLTQIIFSLTEDERKLLLWQLADPNPTDPESLKEKLTVAAEQIQAGEYHDYTDQTLPDLLRTIRDRGQQRLHNP